MFVLFWGARGGRRQERGFGVVGGFTTVSQAFANMLK